MRCTAIAVEMRPPVALTVIERTERPTAVAMQYDSDTALHVSCFAGANFCRCWMPAWYQLAEIVAAERRAANH